MIDGVHTFLPHLEAFRFVLVGHDEDVGLYKSVVRFLMDRQKLRRLDLGGCPWDLVVGLLPNLVGLRVLGVRIPNVTQSVIQALVKSLPGAMTAINLSVIVSDKVVVRCPAFFFFPFSPLGYLIKPIIHL